MNAVNDIRILSGAIFALLIIILPSSSWSMPEYAEKTRQGCMICHVDEFGGDLNDQGLVYAASGYAWPPEGGYRVLSLFRKSVRFIIGAFHIIAAFIWFGTILYVHIVLRPGYAARGLPRGEVLLGIASMSIVGITGILLTISKIKSLDILFKSQWGLLLSTKIFFYLIMIASASFVILYVGPRLKRGTGKAAIPKGGVFDPMTLSAFDGKEGRSAFIAYSGKVYDVSKLKLWKNGTHIKHQAGLDMTDSLPKAPHGPEKLEALGVVGSYDAALRPPRTFAQKAFYFIAYMNLTIVFLVLIVIAYWQWGI